MFLGGGADSSSDGNSAAGDTAFETFRQQHGRVGEGRLQVMSCVVACYKGDREAVARCLTDDLVHRQFTRDPDTGNE